MSFSKEVKGELCKLKDHEKKPRPVLAGLFAYSRLFLEGTPGIRSETESVTALCAKLVRRGLGEEWEVTAEHDHLFLCAPRELPIHFSLDDLAPKKGEEALFIRGAFLACGTLSEPMRAYELAFSLSEGMSEQTLLEMMPQGVFPFRVADLGKEGKRLYLKDSTSIEEFLTWIGAHQSVLNFMEVKVYKEIRNQANRVNNFDTSNIEKAASVGAEQAMMVEKLKQIKKWDTLPEDVKTLGQLRVENPEVTLQELGELSEPPLSRSSVFRRMEKIRKCALEIEK